MMGRYRGPVGRRGWRTRVVGYLKGAAADKDEAVTIAVVNGMFVSLRKSMRERPGRWL